MSLHSTLESWLVTHAEYLAVVLSAIAVGVAWSIIMPIFRKPLDVRGKVCPHLLCLQGYKECELT